MSTDLASLALGWIAEYGAPMVATLLFMGGLGLPLPSTLLVIASGAFIRQSLLETVSTPLLGYLGTVAGDDGSQPACKHDVAGVVDDDAGMRRSMKCEPECHDGRGEVAWTP